MAKDFREELLGEVEKKIALALRDALRDKKLRKVRYDSSWKDLGEKFKERDVREKLPDALRNLADNYKIIKLVPEGRRSYYAVIVDQEELDDFCLKYCQASPGTEERSSAQQ